MLGGSEQLNTVAGPFDMTYTLLYAGSIIGRLAAEEGHVNIVILRVGMNTYM